MKIFISCSTSFYNKIPHIKEELEQKGYEVILPCSYENPNAEEEAWEEGHETHAKVVREFFRQSEEKVKSVDALLCLNFDKVKNCTIYPNYIGGAVYTELYEAFRNEKKIFLYHDIPEGILFDEISGFDVVVINEDLNKLFSILDNHKKSKELSFGKFNPPVSVKSVSGFDEPSNSYRRYVEYQKDCSAGGRVRAAEHRTTGPISDK
ncbi:MAG: hypothetical protein IKX00_02460 [Bacilli bacterium]|nr:hypothetical protein [Bacilli bacterium]